MLKDYDTDCEGVSITPHNVERLTGLSLEMAVALTGVFGCSNGGIRAELTGIYPIIKIKVVCELAEMERGFSVKDKRIENRNIKVYSPGNGTGTKIYKAQIDAAIEEGFSEITLWASGGKENPSNNGNVTFAKYGFVMEGVSQKLFDDLLKHHGRNEKNIHELISTEEGLEFWKIHGRHWIGIFDLSKGSVNLQIWERYYNTKFPGR